LEYGSRCIRNVLILVSANDFSGTVMEALNLRQFSLANGAFIALSSDNPAVSLSYAKDLLLMDSIEENLWYLGCLYAAESLAMLNRPLEAVEYLHPNKIGEKSLSDVFPIDSFSSSSTSSVPLSAKHVLYVNLAVAYILKEDLQSAQHCLQQALSIQNSPQALTNLSYLLLRQGNISAALNVIKTQSFTFV